MDLFDFDSLKMKKAGALLWYNHLPSLTKLFRLIELCLALVLLSWMLNRLPFAMRISGEVFRQIARVIASPIFVFLLCNAIIVTLIVKSGRFSSEIPAPENAETELYEELLKNNEIRCSKPLPSDNPSSPPPNATEELEFQDKEIISQVNAVIHTGEDEDNIVEMEMSLASDSEPEPESESDSDSETPKIYRRSKSEKVERKCKENMEMKNLWRSETEKCMNKVKSAVGGREGLWIPGDELSDQEFQRAVDEFIAKHLRFRHQEFVVQNQSSTS